MRTFERRYETVVIGGGQARLAVGYHLKRRGGPFVILDDQKRIGDAWRKRWASLHLFTPGRYDSLPGKRFPGSARRYPSKDEVADYLESYACEFELPVRTGVRVDRLTKGARGFELQCGDHVLGAENVLMATGPYQRPRIPPFAQMLDERIVQLHSKTYRNASQLRQGGVLVVGAGNSGAEIAMELAPLQPRWLSGRDTGQEPTRAGSLADQAFTPVMWFVANRILTVRTPLGRRVRDHFLHPPWSVLRRPSLPLLAGLHAAGRCRQGCGACRRRPGLDASGKAARSRLRGAPVSSRALAAPRRTGCVTVRADSQATPPRHGAREA